MIELDREIERSAESAKDHPLGFEYAAGFVAGLRRAKSLIESGAENQAVIGET